MIRLESSDAANLSAEAVALGYRSGEGISPGRLLRTAQALARAIMVTLRSKPSPLTSFDRKQLTMVASRTFNRRLRLMIDLEGGYYCFVWRS